MREDPLKIKVPVHFPENIEEETVESTENIEAVMMAEESTNTHEAVISIAEENEDDISEPPAKITKKVSNKYIIIFE